MNYKFATLLIALTAMPALAWDGIKTGTVQTLEFWANGNVRVALTGVSSGMCTATNSADSWISIGQQGATDSSVKSLISALIAAKLAGKPVTIYSMNLGTQCVIGAATLAN
ncbi:MAG: hypothetical protein ACOZQL_20130 [Myxococcota bacterium]